MGELVPVATLEAVPGDRFNLGSEAMVRFAPLQAPIMHRCDVSFHWFFVPNRILWKNWEKFITNTLEGGLLPAFPYLEIGTGSATVPYNKLCDYLGLPNPAHNTGANVDAEKVSALPFAAYQKVWYEYYRDQNVQLDDEIFLQDGDNSYLYGINTLRKRAWQHDYFTAALPFAQKGAAVELPLGEMQDLEVRQRAALPDMTQYVGTSPTQGGSLSADAKIVTGGTLAVDDGQLYVPTSELADQATTINDLRRAMRLQEWLEKAARGGSRYIESILQHFGVRSSDARLQRPEYIVGTKAPVTISEVLSTAQVESSTGSVPQANMAGHGISVQSGRMGSYYCEEHGYLICMMSVMPKPAYFQGINRHFLKINDPFEYYWPSFANIGEQEVKNKELFAYVNTGDGTFGYVPRYAEYKYMPSRVAGDFRDTLDFWHMARKFANKPALNADFIEADPTTRVFAVTDPNIDHLWCHVFHNISARRPMPKFGTPSF